MARRTLQAMGSKGQADMITGLARRAALQVMAAVALGAGLSGGAMAQGPAGTGKGPVVLAAASLTETLNAAADAWAKKGHPRPVLSFAASSVLARQVDAGAPADIFISADEEWMDYLAKKNAIRPQARADLLSNSVVLVAPVDSTITIRIAKGFPLAAVLGDKRLATGGPGVPINRYAKQALSALGVWDQVSPKLAGAESVRAALALVARGEAPLGIVYKTDALAEKKVKIIGIFPEDTHEPVRYPVAVLAGAKNADAAAFVKFLHAGEAKGIFRAAGFGVK
jgi:molybdate transport system substrate-binding protein